MPHTGIGGGAVLPAALDRTNSPTVLRPVVAPEPGWRGSGPAVRPDWSLIPENPAWPSIAWLEHLRSCARARRCTRLVVFPDWWRALVTRGKPFHEDAEESLQAASRRVARFKGYPPLLPEPRDFTRAAVLDSLCVAPAPIGASWVKMSLSSVSQLVRWAHTKGYPLTREHVFAETTRLRFLDDTSDKTTEDTRSLYAARLELIADALNGVTPLARLPRPSARSDAPVEPLTATEEADLWFWATRLGRDTTRLRLTAVLALGLGCGLTRREQMLLTREHVTRDRHGVQVQVTDPGSGAVRPVTCRATWEDRLWEVVEAVAPGHYLLTPWTTHQVTGNVIDQTLARAETYSAPLWWSITRLRNTWLVHHLTVGTPLPVLLTAAGLTHPGALDGLIYLVPPHSAATATAAMRGPA